LDCAHLALHYFSFMQLEMPDELTAILLKAIP
jgi:hypothetical protein